MEGDAINDERRIIIRNTALLELAQIFGIEGNIPIINFNVGPQDFANQINIIANANRSPVVDDRVFVARIDGGCFFEEGRADIFIVWNFAFIEGLKEARLHFNLQVAEGGYNEVQSVISLEESGFHHVFITEKSLVDGDAGLFFKILNNGGSNPNGPIQKINLIGGVRKAL